MGEAAPVGLIARTPGLSAAERNSSRGGATRRACSGCSSAQGGPLTARPRLPRFGLSQVARDRSPRWHPRPRPQHRPGSRDCDDGARTSAPTSRSSRRAATRRAGWRMRAALAARQAIAGPRPFRPGRARQQIARLAAAADVFVTTDHEAAACRTGYGFEQLAANPRLVYCRVTGFGPRGPCGYPADPGVAAAKSGRMQAFAGLAEREGPGYAAVQVANHACSQSAATGILAASDGAGAQRPRPAGRDEPPAGTHALRPPRARARRAAAASRAVSCTPAAGRRRRARRSTTTLLPAKDGRWLQMGNLLQHLFEHFSSPPPGWRTCLRARVRPTTHVDRGGLRGPARPHPPALQGAHGGRVDGGLRGPRGCGCDRVPHDPGGT